MAHLDVAPPRRVQLPVDLNVKLTEGEDRLCTLLDECTQYLKTEKGISTSCRIAGGWVRDKVRDIFYLVSLRSHWYTSCLVPKVTTLISPLRT